MTEEKINKKDAELEVKTFHVPFSLEEIKENIIVSTASSYKHSKEEIIDQAAKFYLQGKISEAAKLYQNLINQGIKDHKVYSNYGIILKAQGNLQEAEKKFRKAIEIKTDYAKAHTNLGVILKGLGKLKEAELYLRKAIELDPNSEEANYNLSLILLRLNKFKEGFIRYESRWKTRGMNKPFITSKPEWEPMQRGRVLLWAEQGIGEEILVASLISELVDKVDTLIFQVDKRLIPLFKRSFDKRIIYIQKNKILEEEKYDSQISICSMIRYLRDETESFKKGKRKYLKVNEKKTMIFKDNILKDSQAKKIVGISWCSKSQKHKDKSISLVKFILGINSQNICFLNLQYGDTKDEINKIKKKYNIDIFDLEEVDKFNNIDDLASLINACDMVVSIENITSVLAGALGINSKILLKLNCLWYNGNNELESYWFTNQSLFRQTLRGEWEKALRQIKNEIKNFT